MSIKKQIFSDYQIKNNHHIISANLSSQVFSLLSLFQYNEHVSSLSLYLIYRSLYLIISLIYILLFLSSYKLSVLCMISLLLFILVSLIIS